MMILSKNGTPLETYMKHGTSGKLQQFYQSFDTGRKKLQSLPVCPKCERVGFRDKGWKDRRSMCCPHCGYQGQATHQVSAYLNDKLYK